MFINLRSDVFDIGKKNYIAIKEDLAKNKLKITAKDIGGNKGRSVYFNLDNGEIEIYFAGRRLKNII